MKSVFLTGLLFSASSFASYLTPADNLDMLKHQITAYHSSGAYAYDVNKAANKALAWIKTEYQHNKKIKPKKRLAIVLDIDETSLSNYRDLKHLGFGGTAQMQNNAEDSGDDPAIVPTLTIYQYAIRHNITVFFITGRDESSRESTIKNLVSEGYASVKDTMQNCELSEIVTPACNLYLRDGKYLNTSAIPYKTVMRKKITKAGYTIIANIGDQYSDLSGGYSLRTFKYPNYMYYIP